MSRLVNYRDAEHNIQLLKSGLETLESWMEAIDFQREAKLAANQASDAAANKEVAV